MTRYTYEVKVWRTMTVEVEAPEGPVGRASARRAAIDECDDHGDVDFETTLVKEENAA